MAQVAQRPATETWIDHSLDYVLAVWRSIPALAQEWTQWDEHDRLVFAIDWPVVEDRLGRLREAAASGRLSLEQRARYDELVALIALHRPTLDRLLAD